MMRSTHCVWYFVTDISPIVDSMTLICPFACWISWNTDLFVFNVTFAVALSMHLCTPFSAFQYFPSFILTREPVQRYECIAATDVGSPVYNTHFIVFTSNSCESQYFYLILPVLKQKSWFLSKFHCEITYKNQYWWFQDFSINKIRFKTHGGIRLML